MEEHKDQNSIRHVTPRSNEWMKNAGIGIEKRRRSSLATNYKIENNKVIIENADGTVQELEIVGSKEKHGVFRKALPILPVPFAIVCFFLNLIPGLGTLVSGFGALCGYKSELENAASTLCWNVFAAFLQVILTPIIFGWIWSMQRGVLLVQESLNRKVTERDNCNLQPDDENA